MPTLRVNSYELRSAFDAYLLRRGPASPVKTFADLVASGRFLRGEGLEARFEETMKAGDLDATASIWSDWGPAHDSGGVDRPDGPATSLTPGLSCQIGRALADRDGRPGRGGQQHQCRHRSSCDRRAGGRGPQGLPIAVEFLGRPFAEADTGGHRSRLRAGHTCARPSASHATSARREIRVLVSETVSVHYSFSLWFCLALHLRQQRRASSIGLVQWLSNPAC